MRRKGCETQCRTATDRCEGRPDVRLSQRAICAIRQHDAQSTTRNISKLFSTIGSQGMSSRLLDLSSGPFERQWLQVSVSGKADLVFELGS